VQPAYFDPVFREKYLAHLGLVLLHGVSGVVALALGPLLLFKDPMGWGWDDLCAGSHRRWGKVYVVAVLFGGLSGYRLAGIAYGGAMAQAGFSALAVLWLLSVSRAFLLVRRREIPAHRAWIARNYALTFSAVSLRAILSLGQYAGFSMEVLYPWAAWLCWVPNLLLVEVLLRQRPGEG
jgi:uncharacterized membrane protein